MERKKKQDIVKSNALIEAIYSPSNIYQMRLLMAVLLQVKSKEKIDPLERYVVSASDLSAMTGAKNGYPELKKAAHDLLNTQIKITHTPEGKRRPNLLVANIASSCEYMDKQGCIGLRFTIEIAPYLSELRTRFTKYQAINVMPMRSGYGVRLYELCLQWLGDSREFTVEDFKALFELGGQYENRIDNLKKRVIEPALKDINTHSDIRVSFSQRKTGRQVTHFVFNIEKPKKETPAEPLEFEAWVTRFNLAKGKGFSDWSEARKKLGRTYKAYCKDPLAWVRKNTSETEYLNFVKEEGLAYSST